MPDALIGREAGVCLALTLPSPLEIRDAGLAALTPALSRAGTGTGEGASFSVVFKRAQLMDTPARNKHVGEGAGRLRKTTPGPKGYTR
jgi:hypothetical protein